jgi:hypothetical protein
MVVRMGLLFVVAVHRQYLKQVVGVTDAVDCLQLVQRGQAARYQRADQPGNVRVVYEAGAAGAAEGGRKLDSASAKEKSVWTCKTSHFS